MNSLVAQAVTDARALARGGAHLDFSIPLTHPARH